MTTMCIKRRAEWDRYIIHWAVNVQSKRKPTKTKTTPKNTQNTEPTTKTPQDTTQTRHGIETYQKKWWHCITHKIGMANINQANTNHEKNHTAICELEKQHSTMRKPRLPPARSLASARPRRASKRLDCRLWKHGTSFINRTEKERFMTKVQGASFGFVFGTWNWYDF